MENFELVANSFHFLFLERLKGFYRFVDFEGIPEADSDYEEFVGKLVKRLSYSLEPRVPVDRTLHKGIQRLVVGTDARVPSHLSIGPYKATLHPEDITRPVQFDARDGFEAQIARRFLRFAIKGLIYDDKMLWEYGSRFVNRTPLNDQDEIREIDIFPAFSFSILAGEDGRPELSIDRSYCYTDRHSLKERYPEGNYQKEQYGRFLYRFGDDWYPITILGHTGTLGSYYFRDPKTKKQILLLQYIKRECEKSSIAHQIRALQAHDKAVKYKDNKDKYKAAAAPLLYKLYGTDDPKIKKLHDKSVLKPSTREQEILNTLAHSFNEPSIFGRKIKTSAVPKRVAVRVLPTPVHIFGNDYELDVPLKDLGRARWQALEDPEIGPYISPYNPTAFDPQYALLPASMPDSIKEDFLKRIKQTIGKIYPGRYCPEPISFNDIDKKTLPSQLGSLEQALRTRGIQRGYVLLVLPENAHPMLHNAFKRFHWPNYQSQCATAKKIRSFYRKEGERHIAVKEGKYRSYIRHLALGVLLVNRKWLWRFKDSTLAHDLIVGIDVRHHTAVFTFIYADGELMYFVEQQSTKKEKLLAEQVCQVILENVPRDVQDLGITLRSILFVRDGRLFDTEISGIDTAMGRLKAEKVLLDACQIGLVEVHKTSTYHPRLFTRWEGGAIDNPPMGACRILDHGKEAILATTGRPMLDSDRTADPLHVTVVREGLSIVSVLGDLYATSHFAFSAPGTCHRKPFPIALADEILKDVTADIDEDAALYEPLHVQRAVA